MWDTDLFITKLSNAIKSISPEVSIQRGNVKDYLLVGLKANLNSYICYYLIAKDSAKFYTPSATYSIYNEIDISNNNLDEALSFAVNLLKRKYKKKWNINAYKEFATMLINRNSKTELISKFKEYGEMPDNAFKLLKEFVNSDASLEQFFSEREKDFHVPGEPVIKTKKMPTCTQEGICVKTVYCMICSKKISLEEFTTPKVSHVSGNPVIKTKTEPTCTQEGVRTKTVYCMICSKVLSREEFVLPKKSHIPDSVVRREKSELKGKEVLHLKTYCKICHELILDEIAQEVLDTTHEQNGEKLNTPVVLNDKSEKVEHFTTAINDTNGSKQIEDKPKEIETFVTVINDAYNSKKIIDILKVASALRNAIKVDKDEYLASQLFEHAYNNVNEDLKKLKAGEKLDFLPNAEIEKNIFDDDLEQTSSKREELVKEREHLESVLLSISKEIEFVEGRKDNVSYYSTENSPEDWYNLMESKKHNEYIDDEIIKYESIKDEPYFFRMDYLSPDNNVIYIGKDVFIDFENENNNIYSIWSDFGRAFREYRKRDMVIKGNNVKVTKRRRFAIENHKLIDFDDLFIDSVEGDAKKGSKESSNQVQITDPFLIYILKQKREEKNITNIIRTIQSNQNDIIEEKIDSNVVVQGCAGSGKTMILLHRLSNLKYNNPNFDWTSVRIITPNREFTFYLDELSKDLKINSIPKMTLTGYYVELVKKYQMFYLPNSNFDEKVAIRNVIEDYEWDEDIVGYIYSMSFREDMEHEWDVITNVRNNRNQMKFSEIMGIFEKTFNQMIKRKFDSYLTKDFKQYRAIYYAKVLFLSKIFGPLARVTNMLCIDEGQDISYSQYLLINEVNGQKCCFNIFGDMKQKINRNCGLNSWDLLKRNIEFNFYSLNENYRNSVEIVNYYNSRLSVDDIPLGITARDVRQFVLDELEALIQLQLLLENRVAIITNEKDKIPQVIKEYCVDNMIQTAKVSLMNVREVKGLEFDIAIVFDKDMNEQEKYISYTRALSELYTESNEGNQMKTFGVKNI